MGLGVLTVAVTCTHCGRAIVQENGRWVDPEATGDDSVWRETCDAHDTTTAEHEPEMHPTTGADINLDRLTTEEYDALHELVHEQASVLASNAINSGDAIEFLLGNGWSEDDIRTRLGEMTFGEEPDRAAAEGTHAHD